MRNMPSEQSRGRRTISRFGTLIESVIIVILLLSGIGFILVNKLAGLIIPATSSIFVGIGVQVIALIIVGIYVYLRFLKTRLP
jgi:uncharacterized membrane protein (DUF485 family)